MHALIVVESCFGNTSRIAAAIADGLRSAGAEVTVTDAASGPTADGHDLVCVGAPTHNLGLPSARSRDEAARRGAKVPTTGVAEWLAGDPRLAGVRTAAFDTALPSAFSGSAAKRIARRLRAAHASVEGRESFTVAGSPVDLAAGELDRARAWGATLAS
ncbi:flavodoxin family protein [Raineyella sp. W15-4]|uniref:flavodoxin family protein n=1 Tax=Raineyella sp. W15-4 TaxID=3081651 RepID=UPI0029542E55|nr:flavodoxin domain-containing protein [Raineyella sp. W15-4]WOQ17265.1 flavodoxin domain-containing protein [Raineyella sp. W15-4]